MKIEILVVDDTHEKCTGMTCFEAKEEIWEILGDHKAVKGIMMIDDVAVKFSFSPYFRDGDIFSTNSAHRLLVKFYVPVYFASLVTAGVKTYIDVYEKTGL
jgi:hypothetical protein